MSTFLQQALSSPPLDLPMEGPWPYGNVFPDRAMIGGYPFTKARWSQRYPGVVEQYREDCAHKSQHLKILRTPSGYRWVIDHTDDYNPDRGQALAHFFHDYEPGQILRPAATTLVGLLLARWLVPKIGPTRF